MTCWLVMLFPMVHHQVPNKAAVGTFKIFAKNGMQSLGFASSRSIKI
jgi:hypothetical protein